MSRAFLITLTLFLTASPGWGTKPVDFTTLTRGQRLGAFTTRALFLDAVDQPMGARFIHDNGTTLDVLLFDSVPQLSLTFRTMPISDRGEPHTGEHLLLGKGRAGKALSTLHPMRLAIDTASTHQDRTVYQYRTVAGPAAFDELLEETLKALIHPDFTDEEVRREVAGWDVVLAPNGKRRLEEKGTVYTEMITSSEMAGNVNWFQLTRMVFGVDHPLTRVAGGLPEGIRVLTVDNIRSYLAQRYHLGPGLSVIVGLPRTWVVSDFLRRLEQIFQKVEPSPPSCVQDVIPAARPEAEGSRRIGAYPSEDQASAQTVLFAWRALETLPMEQSVRLGLLLGVLAGGETSYLYRDLVDPKTRTVRTTVTGVSGYLDYPPMAIPTISVYGVPATTITTSSLDILQEKLHSRIAWIRDLRDGSPELMETLEKAKSLVASTRRGLLMSMQGPPGFGTRPGSIGWHEYLDRLVSGGGFRLSISLSQIYERVSADLRAPRNFWAPLVLESHLMNRPYISVVRPDPQLITRRSAEKAERVTRQEAAVRKRFENADLETALRKFQEEIDAGSRVLDERDRAIGRPTFVSDPPLSLDDLKAHRERLPWGRSLVRVPFDSTPFTTIRLAFDMTGLPSGDSDLLPLLDWAFTDLGVRTRSGETLDYAASYQRISAQIYSLGSFMDTNNRTGRYELVLSATASTPEEVDRAIEWMEDYLTRRVRAAMAPERLLDLVAKTCSGYQKAYDGSETGLSANAVWGLENQDRSLSMILRAPFTLQYYLDRIHVRLRARDPAWKKTALTRIDSILGLLATTTKEAINALVVEQDDELGRALRFHVAHLPPESWREDLVELLSAWRQEITKTGPSLESRLDALLDSVLVRPRVRVTLVGRPSNLDRAQARLKTVIERLPWQERLNGAEPKSKPLVLSRLLQRKAWLDTERSPTHVAVIHKGAKSGTVEVTAPSPTYHQSTPEAATMLLALGVLGGTAPHGIFSKTWSAGLAYSNGVGFNLKSGRCVYSANRCPDPARTVRYVVGLVKDAKLTDPTLLDYALSLAFGDYRGADDFASRGIAQANDFEDGLSPEVVRAFKGQLLRTARDPSTLEAVRKALPSALGRLLPGVGPRQGGALGVVSCVVGPEDMLARYESFLKESGEKDPLVRLYPRDFWPPAH